MLDRRHFDVRLTVKNIVDSLPEYPSTGEQYLLSSSSAVNANCIAYFNGVEWIFTSPRQSSLEIFNLATGDILKFNGTNWQNIFSIDEKINSRIATNVEVAEVLSEVFNS